MEQIGKVAARVIAPEYYVSKSSEGFYELKQTRFKHLRSHPHDVCAVAWTIDDLKAMADKYLVGAVDWTVS